MILRPPLFSQRFTNDYRQAARVFRAAYELRASVLECAIPRAFPLHPAPTGSPRSNAPALLRHRLATGFARLILLACFLSLLPAQAAEIIPPAPKQFFNDYAHVVSPATAQRLNQTLENFERETSSQILVVVYPKLQSDSSIEDYTVRVAEAWKVGQKGKDNGAVLFVFVQDRKMFIQVGYGLEGALPDALAKRIIETEIKPRFRQGDYDGGLTAGVTAILAATKGEYKGTGALASERGRPVGIGSAILTLLFFGVLGLLFLSAIFRRARSGAVYRRSGYRYGGWGGGGWSGGGGWGGGGGGFSGGGGSFGGGGAGGSW